MSTPTPVKIAAAQMYERLRFEVLTVDAIEAALNDTYRLWEYQGMFCPDTEAHEEPPHIAAQALRDAEREMPCEHHGSCLIAGNDGCAAPEDGGMLRAAMLRRADRIEAHQ